MRLRLLPAILLPLAGAPAAAPLSYEQSATVASVPLTGGASFGTKFFFTTSSRAAYRVIPAGGEESDPAASWEYWSASAGAQDILPAAGYDSLDVAGLSPAGGIIGKTSTETPSHREAALYWTPAGGPLSPAGFDSGYSGLNAINASGLAAGFSDSGTYENVTWDARAPAAGVTAISLPSGYTSPQVLGVSGRGEVLLYMRDSGGVFRATIWDGSATVPIGPAPAGTFYPSNCAINTAGDVAMLVFTAGGAAKLHYIPASDRAAWLTFTFAGPVDSSAYNLRISDAGVASFDTSFDGVNSVGIVSSRKRQQYEFPGYRSWLNNSGALVFGNEGKVNFWDAATWAGSPLVVPVSISSDSGGMDTAGFSDDGNLLILNTLRSRRSLGILQPVYVTAQAARKTLRLRRGAKSRTVVVSTQTSQDTRGAKIRFLDRGAIPAGMRFRKNKAILVGRPKQAGRRTLRVAALYTAKGVRQQTRFVAVRIVVR